MGNSFQSPPIQYAPEGIPESPFLRARQMWDERLGATVYQARNWRLVAIISAVTSVMLIGVVLTLVNQARLIPMIVTVDKVSGETNILGTVTENRFQPHEPEVRHFLSQWIQRVRSLPLDPVVVKQNWLQAYKFMDGPSARKLNTLVQSDDENAFHKVGEETITVEPISMITLEGGQSFQARWRERVWDKSGSLKDMYTMVAVISVEIIPPKDEEVLLVNPLGIIITSFQWSKELR